MKILEVTFDCTIPMPGYANVKPGIGRATLDEGETPEQAWTELNRRAQAWHRKEYPHLYDIDVNNIPTHPVPGVNQFMQPTPKEIIAKYQSTPIIDKSIERLEIQIDNANTLEELDKILLSNDNIPSPLLTQIEVKKDQLVGHEK